MPSIWYDRGQRRHRARAIGSAHGSGGLRPQGHPERGFPSPPPSHSATLLLLRCPLPPSSSLTHRRHVVPPSANGRLACNRYDFQTLPACLLETRNSEPPRGRPSATGASMEHRLIGPGPYRATKLVRLRRTQGGPGVGVCGVPTMRYAV